MIAIVVQAALRAAGIQAEIRQVEQIVEAMNTGDFDAAVRRYGSTPTADPGFALNVVYASTGADNRHLNYVSPRLDAVVARLNEASAPSERRDLALEAQRVLQDEAPAAFLASPRGHIALSQRVQGFEWRPSSDYYYVTHQLSLT